MTIEFRGVWQQDNKAYLHFSLLLTILATFLGISFLTFLSFGLFFCPLLLGLTLELKLVFGFFLRTKPSLCSLAFTFCRCKPLPFFAFLFLYIRCSEFNRARGREFRIYHYCSYLNLPKSLFFFLLASFFFLFFNAGLMFIFSLAHKN